MKRWTAGVILGTTLSCGPRVPELAPLARSPSVTVAAPSATPEDEIVSPPPAAEFDGLLFHFEAPRRDLPKVARLVPDQDVVSLLLAPELLLVGIVGEELAPAVDPDAPVDFAVGTGDDYPRAVLLHVRESEVHGLRTRRMAKGPVRLDGGGAFPACELWHLSDGHRLLCASSPQTADDFAPGLLTAKFPGGAAFRALLSGANYRKFMRMSLDDEAHEDESNFERSALDLAQAFIDNDRLGYELELLPDGLELAMTVGYDERGHDNHERPAAFNMWLKASTQPRPLPEAVVLPGQGVSLANAGMAPTLFAALETLTLGEFVKAMQAETFATQDQLTTLSNILTRLIPSEGRFYFASGQDLAALDAAFEKAPPERAANAAERRRLERALGSWVALRFDQAPQPYLDAIREGVKFDSVRIEDRPEKKSPPDPTFSNLRLAPGVPPGLPKGTLHVVEDMHANPKFKPSAKHPNKDAVTGHCLFVPDGDHVWIVGSRSEKVAIATARAALAAKPITAAAGVAQAPQFSVRLSPAGVVGFSASFDNPEDATDARAGVSALRALPQRGQSELELTAEVRAVGAEHPGHELRFATRLSFDAAAAWIQWAVQRRSGAHGLLPKDDLAPALGDE